MKKIILLLSISFLTNTCIRQEQTPLTHLVLDEYWDYQPNWSPDGKKIIFASSRYAHPTLNIFTMDTSGKNIKQFTFTKDGYGDKFPIFSPNGKKIAFISDRGQGYRSLYIMDADGKNEKFLVDHVGNQAIFTKDSQFILSEIKSGSNTDIFKIDIKSGEQEQVTDFKFAVSNPSLHPNGRFLAINSGRHGNPEIEVFNIETKELIRLTNFWSDDGSPDWSKDGKYIYFYSNRDEPKYEIYRIEVATKKWERITHSINWDLDARVSPDGHYITFHTSQKGRYGIAIAQHNGSSRKIISNKKLTPFIEIVKKENLDQALNSYPSHILDSLYNSYVFEAELCGLAYELFKQDQLVKAQDVIEFIEKQTNTSWTNHALVNDLRYQIDSSNPLPQGVFFDLILTKGVEEGKKIFLDQQRNFPLRKPYTEYEFIMFAYWFHFHGDYKGSITLLNLLLELYPNSYKAFHDLGNSYRELGDIEKAIIYHEKSEILDPEGWYGKDSSQTLKDLKEYSEIY